MRLLAPAYCLKGRRSILSPTHTCPPLHPLVGDGATVQDLKDGNSQAGADCLETVPFSWDIRKRPKGPHQKGEDRQEETSASGGAGEGGRL